MLHNSALRADLRTLMRRGADQDLPDDDFNTLALRVFEHQFELNVPYRNYCERRGRTPGAVEHWTAIPAVPTAAFKEVALVCGEADAAPVVFRTSGTTRGAEKRGTHYLLDPSLYDASLHATFTAFVLPDAITPRMVSLVPDSAEQPDSSLSYMITALLAGAGEGGFFASRSGVDSSALDDVLRRSIREARAVCLLGTTLAFAHWLDGLGGTTYDLAAGSRLMDTGGFKGESREVTPQQMRERYEHHLRIPARFCVNEYGMTELCSQYYDTTIRDGDDDGRVRSKRGAPWLRARVVDPDALEPMKKGETGILQHFDLANLDSVSAVITEDLAYETDAGFALIGRAPGATPRGCSIAMDMLLTDASRT